MRIFTNAESFHPDPASPVILALGNFDGFHLGHQKILSRILDDARTGGQASIFTFQEHPKSVLNPASAPSLLMSGEHRLLSFDAAGIANCFFIPFTEAFSELDPAFFVEKILVERIQIKKMVLGHDAHFGKGRKGTVSVMKTLAEEFGFDFEVVEAVWAGGSPVSSSRIRELVSLGKLDEAEACLGRPFSVLGQVVRGDGRGKTLGFPTANVQYGSGIMPPEGVYPVKGRRVKSARIRLENDAYDYRSTYDDQWLYGVINFGRRPTFGAASKPLAEAHFFDFSGNLYDQVLEIFFYPRLREERTFLDGRELQKQLVLDVAAACQFFKKQSPNALDLKGF